MKRIPRLPGLILLLAAFLLVADPPAKAGIPTGTEVVLIFVAVGAVGAAIGVGVYYAVRQKPSITGCVVSGRAGLVLENQADQKVFLLTGDTAGIQAGDRVRVRGKKKTTADGPGIFVVDKLRNDYGACKASATP